MVRENNQVWFKGIDVARILGYSDTDQAIRKHIDVEDKRIPPFRWGSPATYINEHGLYSLAFSSKTEAAKALKNGSVARSFQASERLVNTSYPCSMMGKQFALLKRDQPTLP